MPLGNVGPAFTGRREAPKSMREKRCEAVACVAFLVFTVAMGVAGAVHAPLVAQAGVAVGAAAVSGTAGFCFFKYMNRQDKKKEEHNHSVN